MTVNELIAQLEEAKANGHGSAEVLLSKDAEGNSYSPCRGYFSAEGAPVDSCPWYWDLSDEPTADVAEEDRYVVHGERPVVVLKPVN